VNLGVVDQSGAGPQLGANPHASDYAVRHKI
jgi:hypothetical protein